ncbi:MAG TPA: DNA-directed RNA polymerase subunit omega [Oligoflexus sp.]|uniref:DNA-directed RNA polymerase subunit omega n=1 Tax=Oligoflexus sp. TaxID=1971216 RepID=UPI002D7FFF10|nr:DNA-directed RNA polymerase subunit omega [Oligoflexus sp.]HET9236432.1 DNA-directed RNA polymerase subunit omega [Oligoflexus sp.]
MARVSIEDCLQYIENRFALVAVASHRTRQLMEGKTPLVKTKNKEAVTALREIAEGLVVSVQPEGVVSPRQPTQVSVAAAIDPA